jgi:hypothetical protein
VGRPAWADRPRPVSARFGPVLLPDVSRPIVDLHPSACGPLTSSSPRFSQGYLLRKFIANMAPYAISSSLILVIHDNMIIGTNLIV